MSKMFEKLERGEIVLGTISISNGGPEWVEILGNCGFDFHVTDFMITSVTWENASQHMRAANQFDMTPWIRLQAYPWEGYFDPRMVADTLRALSIGAEVVMVSIDSAAEVEAVLKPANNWHRRVYLYKKDLDPAELDAHRAQLDSRTLIVPHIESAGAAHELDKILAVPSLKAIFLGMGDLSRVMGHAGDPTHPEMRAFVSDTVAKASARGIHVFANIGYFDEPQKIADAALWMWEAGVRAIWITYPEYIVQRFYMKTLERIRDAVPLAVTP